MTFPENPYYIAVLPEKYFGSMALGRFLAPFLAFTTPAQLSYPTAAQ
jgi:hypothetical protein